MNFSAELFLAWRYFKPKRSAVSIITLISVVGVALGVCVLIVVIAIMAGFSDHLKQKLLETGSHGQIMKRSAPSERHPDGAAGKFSADEAQELIGLLTRRGAVECVPVLKSPVLFQAGESFNPKVLLAFDPALRLNNFPLREAVERARRNEERNAKEHGWTPRDTGKYSLGSKEVLISSVMANEYRLSVGSRIILHTPSRLMGMLKRDENGNYTYNEKAEKYLPAELTVAGIYTFDKYDFDRNVIFMGLDEADDLFGLDWGDSTHIFLWTRDPFRMEDFNRAVRADLQRDPRYFNVFYSSWEDMNRRFLDVLQVEKNMMFFLLIFIVLVAAFSITNTLITTVIQKTREIGLLKAVGTSSGSILRIFVLQGAFVGLIGTCFGVLAGWLVVVYRMNILRGMRMLTGMEIFPKEMYLFSELPAHIIWGDVLVICVISVALCTCGAILPALRAAKLDPAKALRYES